MGAFNEERPQWFSFDEGNIKTKVKGESIEFTTLQGRIVALRVVDETFGGEDYKKLQINLHDGKALMILQMKLNSGYGRAFCCMLPNIDITKDVFISGGYKVVNERGKTTMYIKQGNKNIKWHFTKENPRELPMPEIYTIGKGKNIKQMLDFGAQTDFFIKMIAEYNTHLNSSAAPMEKGPQLEPTETGTTDDLPF